MADTPWMPMWWADYLADTRHLSTEEHGAYMLLIGAYWMAGAPLVDDDKRLARITGLSLRKWKSIRPVLEEFFTIEQKKWVSKRINDELFDAKKKRLKRVEAGKKSRGLRGKSEQNQGENPSNATVELPANEEQCPSITRGNPQSQSHIKRTTNVVPKKDDETNSPPEATGKPLKPDKPQSKRGTRLPDDWKPSLADEDFAKKEGLNHASIRAEADKFRDYWIAKTGTAATKLDWSATWRNWVRNSKKSGGSFGGNTTGRGASSGQRSRSGSLSSVCADMLSGDQDTHGVSEDWGASDGHRPSDIQAEAERGRIIDG